MAIENNTATPSNPDCVNTRIGILSGALDQVTEIGAMVSVLGLINEHTAEAESVLIENAGLENYCNALSSRIERLFSTIFEMSAAAEHKPPVNCETCQIPELRIAVDYKDLMAAYAPIYDLGVDLANMKCLFRSEEHYRESAADRIDRALLPLKAALDRCEAAHPEQFA